MTMIQELMTSVYLDDLIPGQHFRTQSYALAEAELTTFAAQFDPQPFHLDPQAARQSVFGGLVASGWYTAAITMRLMVTSGISIAGGVVGLGGEISWPKPTRPGDELHVEAEVLEVAASRRPDRGVATLRCETRNQRGESVQVLTVKLLVPRRSAAAAGESAS